MPVNPHHSEGKSDPGNRQIPLYDFFLSLKQNGFLVTPAQIADSHTLIARYAGEVANESDLCDYLSPLFASSEEEQEKFKALFDQHYCKRTLTTPPGPRRGKIPEQVKKHWWKVLLAGMIIATAIILLSEKEDQAPFKDFIFLRSNYREAGRDFFNAFTVMTGDTLAVYPQTNDSGRDSIYNISLVTKYDWGDQTALDTSGRHRYTNKGIFPLKAFIDVYYGAQVKYKDTLLQLVKVCDENNLLVIDNPLRSDSVKMNENFILTAKVSGRQPDSIRWSNGQQWLSSGMVLDTAFAAEGNQQITAVAIYDSLGSPCTLSSNLNLVVYDPGKPLLSATIVKTPNANLVKLPHKVKPHWFLATGLVFLASFIGMIFLGKWKRNAKKRLASKVDETEKQYNELVSAFAGKKPPFELPFRTKNALPLPEPELNEVAWQMRRRIDDDATYLHLDKTIDRAIRNGGFFQPVSVPRTHQSEYLVLIDEINMHNQQVKLFEYLVEQLRKQNVFIDRFYYRQEPNLCYNTFEPGGISLEKLYEKYPRHILLIFGNAYQLIYKFYPIFDHDYLHLIRRWKYKAVITPVPVPDWGLKELHVLGDEIPVLPADIYGQLVLMKKIFSGEQMDAVDFNEFRDRFYNVATVDFEEVDELAGYCNEAGWACISPTESTSNILFQWVAALALYPRIRWEMILAIGKAIVEKYGKPEELNFTNLLRIARIKWISEGQFPDYTRLELLKNLETGNEVLARETILILLKEIPDHEIEPNHFVYEEKEIQRIINEFNLYAYDPVKYGQYEGSRLLFEKLWKEKKILDGPAKVYLKNEGKEWRTLVKRPGDKPGMEAGKENVPLKEYIDEETPDTSGLKSMKLWAGFIISLLFLGSLLGLLFLTVLNFINTDSLPVFTYQKTIYKNADFTFRDSSNLAVPFAASIQIDTLQYELAKDSTVSIPLVFNDSLKRITINTNGQELPDNSMVVDYDKYTVIVHSTPVDNQLRATIYLEKSCAASVYDYSRNINNADKNILITDSLVDLPGFNAGAPCLTRISFGGRVSANLVNRIIENFKKSGIDLVVDPVSLYPLTDNQVALYSGLPIPAENIRKPTIYIELSDKSLVPSVQGFERLLEAKGYSVASTDVANHDYNSQVSYYDKNQASEATAVQQLYRSYYPKLLIPTRLVSNKGTNSRDRINVWIRKLEDAKLPLRLGSEGNLVKDLQGLLLKAGYTNLKQNGVFDKETETAVRAFQRANYVELTGTVDSKLWDALVNFKPKPEDNYSNIQQAPQQATLPPEQAAKEPDPNVQVNTAGSNAAAIAEAELGYREDPAGSNNTKYGQWYGADGLPWSGVFVSWVYGKAGKTLSGVETSRGFSSFRTALNYFRKNRMITENPVEGDIVIITSSKSNQYTGGIFVGHTRAIGGFAMIAGNSAEKGPGEGDAVVRLSLVEDPKTTYFIHVPDRSPAAAK